MKTWQIMFVCVVLSIALAVVDHTAFAQKEVKLIGAPKGMRNKARMPADLLGDTIIIGAHAVGFLNMDGFAKVYTRSRNKWEETAELIRGDRNKENPGQASFGFSVAITGPPGRGDPTYAIVGSPSSGPSGRCCSRWRRGLCFRKVRTELETAGEASSRRPGVGRRFRL